MITKRKLHMLQAAALPLLASSMIGADGCALTMIGDPVPTSTSGGNICDPSAGAGGVGVGGGGGGVGGAAVGAGGADVGATTAGAGGDPGAMPQSGAQPCMPANAYINCVARGLSPGACSLLCGEVGAPCSSIASHPYKSGEGPGQLTYCKNGWPSYTCTYTFANTDACTGNFTPLGVGWLCLYAGGK